MTHAHEVIPAQSDIFLALGAIRGHQMPVFLILPG